MAQPYVGEIRMFGGNFNPNGWMFCEGQLLPIAENEVLFQLIGTTYGGDGESTFALPNLQSRVPMHFGAAASGTTYQLAEMNGTEQVTLTTQQLPAHSHPLVASTGAAQANLPTDNVTAQSSLVNLYSPEDPLAPMAANMLQPVGGSQPHENCQPFLCVNFIISLFGLFPSLT
jgi:microcystin-dependent protein